MTMSTTPPDPHRPARRAPGGLDLSRRRSWRRTGLDLAVLILIIVAAVVLVLGNAGAAAIAAASAFVVAVFEAWRRYRSTATYPDAR